MTTVLLTGASGFIAKHILRELLAQDYSVRASVRSATRRAEVEALFPDAEITFVNLDLTSDTGWSDALDGVDALIHTASPFPTVDPKDPQTLIRPAVDGTRRALRAAQAAGVKRVILTSSCAAIYKDSAKPPSKPSTRSDWTDPQGEGVSAYEASKTLAERAAWEFAAEHPSMELTVINPGLVFGPPMDHHYGSSLENIEQFLNGGIPMLPDLMLPVVDVRDVARAHVRALATPASVGQRFPATVDAPTMQDMARTLAAAYPGRRIPTRRAPSWLIRILARFNPLVRTIAPNLGRNLRVDGSDAQNVFEFTYIPVSDALLASAAFIVARENAPSDA